MDAYSRVLGSFFGAATGDAMGAATETMTPQMICKRYGGYLDTFATPGPGTFLSGRPAASVTDDFSLAYFTAQAILDAGGIVNDEVAAKALFLWSDHPEYYCFAGPSTKAAVMRLRAEPVPESPIELACDNAKATNGSAMKIFPAGLMFPGRPEKAIEAAITLCKPTHFNTASLSGACAVAAAVSAAADGATLPAVLDAGFLGAREGAKHGLPVSVASVEKRMELAVSIAEKKQSWEQTMLDLADIVGSGLSANEAVPCVFGILAATDADTLSAIKMGVNIGNDTDTVATMVGAIAGAMNGAQSLPDAWLDQLCTVNGIDIPAIAKQFTEVFYR